MSKFMGENIKDIDNIDVGKMIVTTESDKKYTVVVSNIKVMPNDVEIYKRDWNAFLYRGDIVNDTILVIKDCIFENTMMGKDLIQTLRDLHFIDGFNKEDIFQEYNELIEEANK